MTPVARQAWRAPIASRPRLSAPACASRFVPWIATAGSRSTVATAGSAASRRTCSGSVDAATALTSQNARGLGSATRASRPGCVRPAVRCSASMMPAGPSPGDGAACSRRVATTGTRSIGSDRRSTCSSSGVTPAPALGASAAPPAMHARAAAPQAAAGRARPRADRCLVIGPVPPRRRGRGDSSPSGSAGTRAGTEGSINLKNATAGNDEPADSTGRPRSVPPFAPACV